MLATGAYPAGTIADVFHFLGNAAFIIGLILALSGRASRIGFLEVGIAAFVVFRVAWVGWR